MTVTIRRRAPLGPGSATITNASPRVPWLLAIGEKNPTWRAGPILDAEDGLVPDGKQRARRRKTRETGELRL
jgi:hypothetical protein